MKATSIKSKYLLTFLTIWPLSPCGYVITRKSIYLQESDALMTEKSRPILSVGDLNRAIAESLTEEFEFVLVSGDLGNF